jgi:phosphonate transport system substrate-binding protein
MCTKIVALVLSLALILPPLALGQTKEKKLLIGLIPEMNIFKQKQRFTLLEEYLSKKTGIKIQFTILSRYGNIVERFNAEEMDGAFFGSFTGALAIQKLGVVPLVRPVNLDNTSSYKGYIFTRKGSGIKTAADMKGKRMAFVDKATTAGYIFPLAYLKQHGITSLKGFFKEYYFTGSHDAAISAVLEKNADIGAAKHSVFDRVKKENSRVNEELVIIAESPWVPSNGLCVRKDLDISLKGKLKDALLNLHTDPDGEAVLKKFGAIKFIVTTADDYKPVFEMAKNAGINLKTYDYLNE